MKFDIPFVHRVSFNPSREATMVAIDGTWQRACLLHDISEEDAKIGIDGSCPVESGREFFLLLVKIGLVYRRCHLAWVNGTEIGVHFLGSNVVTASRQRMAA
jgi:hypothetical protein